ncbi:hypothetical protein FRC10_010239 [Ceratobasidium sp. 414]|nr:hypothetical protein FRC10_010239 [Ceratobasidium sp. 414]
MSIDELLTIPRCTDQATAQRFPQGGKHLMGGGKDDKLTRDELDYHCVESSAKYTTNYWRNYGDSTEFQAIHEFKHFNSMMSTASDDKGSNDPAAENTASLLEHKGKGKEQKCTCDVSGSDTEHKAAAQADDNGIVAVKIMSGVNGLVATQQQEISILEQQLQLDVQREAWECDTQNACVAIEACSAQVSELVNLSHIFFNDDAAILAHAQAYLAQLSLNFPDLPALPGAAVPAVQPANLPVPLAPSLSAPADTPMPGPPTSSASPSTN